MNKTIDDKIMALNYNPQQILAFHGEEIENCSPSNKALVNNMLMIGKQKLPVSKPNRRVFFR